MLSDNNDVPTRSISRQLIIYIVLCSSVLTLLLTGFQLYREYQQDVSLIESDFQEINDVHLKSFAASLWSFDTEKLQILIEGMSRIRDVKYVEISGNDEFSIAIGNKEIENSISRTYPLTYEFGGAARQIGELTVVVDLRFVFDRVMDSAISILISNTIKTTLVVLFMLVIIDRIVIRHLKTISAFMKNMQVDQPIEILTLNRRHDPALKKDELDLMVDSVNETWKRTKEAFTRAQLSDTAMHETEELFRAAFQSNHGIATITDFGTGEFIDVSDAWLRLTGFEKHEVIGKTSFELGVWGSDEHRQEFKSELKLRGKLLNFETYSHTKSGNIRDVIINAEVVTIQGKELLFLSGSDVTDRNRFEKQLRRSQKMEAVGRLTGGVAHDFNNLLGIVLGNLEVMQRLPLGDSRITGRIEVAKKAVERGADITRKLLGFSRKGTHKVELVDLNKSIDNLLDLLTKSLTVTIDVTTDLADGLWTVEIDPGDFEDAILNLALNARDAMVDGGKLTITTENKVLDKDFVEGNPHTATGNFVTVSITDTGAGMADKVRDRIFEPFFTTKEVGKGTGLGLSMVYGFVKRSGGFMTLDSEEDNGATFHLYFPRAIEKETGLEVPKQAKDNLPQGIEKILIVDDEEGLRDIAAFSLGELGYKTVVAEDGPTALKILEQDPDIDLLFSDAVMPNSMSIYDLAHTAHKSHPKLKILLTSGYDGKLGEIRKSEVPFLIRLSKTRLKKPYAVSELAMAIRQELDEDL
jgi:PAS domain S-box-containing protein